MRVTVSHNQTEQEVIRRIDKSVDDVLMTVPIAGVEIVDKQKRWNGNLMNFSFTGRMGFFSAPIRGTVLVTDKDVTIDVELPVFLDKLLPEAKIKGDIETRVKGLLT